VIAMLGMRKFRAKRKGPLGGRLIINIRRFGPHPHSYEADVMRSHGSSAWRERVLFDVTPHDAGRNVVEVTDMDYPTDRKLSLILNQEVDMPTFITNFILSGRW
jgi:hypothetical protein